MELRGSQGALDLYCVYLDDQSAAAGRHSFDLISETLLPANEVLTLIIGDFNFVDHANDRTCKETGQPTGAKDIVDAKLFQENVLQKGQLFEVEQ